MKGDTEIPFFRRVSVESGAKIEDVGFPVFWEVLGWQDEDLEVVLVGCCSALMANPLVFVKDEVFVGEGGKPPVGRVGGDVHGG